MGTHTTDELASELGHDAAVLLRKGAITALFTEAAPDGIDVLLDTIGGEHLSAALGTARQGARFTLAGAHCRDWQAQRNRSPVAFRSAWRTASMSETVASASGNLGENFSA